MRSLVKLLALSSASLLSACGGDTGLQTVGSVAPPSGGGGGTPSASPTPTSTHSFVAPTEVKSYEAIGGVQHFEYATRSDGVGQGGQLYAGDANTVRDSGITVAYNPRDAIFEVTINRPLGNVTTNVMRFQDPAHRTDFGGAIEPQASVPDLPASRNIQYLESGTSSGATTNPGDPYYSAGLGAGNSDYAVGAKGFTYSHQTFFYQKPGTTTSYVTYAGFVRNSVTTTETQDNATSPLYLKQSYSFDRGAFVFGERTANSAVPKTGTGSYSGEMIATMVFNPMLDTDPTYPTFFQWIQGTHTTSVNFASLAVTSNFTGTVLAPARDAYTSGAYYLPAGTVFTATAGANIDLVNKGGFTGQFSAASFRLPNTTTFTVNIAGSSIDGAFFGPNGEEIGGGFRIVGGTPNERIDILGAFTGKK
ncbi:transferrin-binding protein-like solute binding protein [Sphingomonas sp. LB-2]|uniref:transferrin-binding protein-like solute binding protein n=1 Tax=Sphingomonas caeni TaxID=2984949 RepID=UPI002231B9C2|nr:transferrin-binding protein-like solute binding protein [Sphingomonas caeni]MCW3848194.1 transferrin-binding protein-like solute binding protein [Sphingomonas caeni]